MDISVVVAVRNEIKYIEKCIKSLYEQDFDGKYEVIVVDGMSDDGTYELLKKLQKKYKFTLLRNPKVNAAAGRNLGVKHAKGKLIAFIDGDAYASKDWFSSIKKAFERVDTDGVGGPDLLPDNISFKSKAIGLVMTSPLARGGRFNPSTQHTMIEEERFVDHIPTCNLCLKRKIFDSVGLFDESFVKGQDLELSYRIRKAGYKLFYSPSVKVVHYRKQTFRSFARQIYKWAKAKIAIIKKHDLHGITSHIYLWPAYGVIAFLLLFSICLLFNLMWFFSLLIFLGLLLYSFVILFESTRIAKKYKDKKIFLYSLILIPTIHLSYAYGVMVALM
ncbi:MAG: hypothetical protein DRJ99_03325, partial [Thermoplasmata archaeon]